MDLRPQPGGEHCPDPPPPTPAELQGGRGLAPVQPDIVEGGSLSLTREPPSHQVTSPGSKASKPRGLGEASEGPPRRGEERAAPDQAPGGAGNGPQARSPSGRARLGREACPVSTS